MDLARSVQEVTEEVIMKMARHIKEQTGQKNLCLAGGVAMNCVSNGKILRDGLFENIWIQPAAGDAGGALGAALFAWYQYLENSRTADGINDFQRASLLGPQFDNDFIRRYLDSNGIVYSELKDDQIAEKVADLIAEQKVVGWFEGPMEFGPRALGSRSIIADCRSEKMQEMLNLKIKFRESFRPFAPSVLEEKAGQYFEIDTPSPYMLLVVPVRKEICKSLSPEQEKLVGLEKLKIVRSRIPAVTHVDYSARLQTVSKKDNPLFYEVLKKLDEKYDCPAVINTSFNVRGEPIVCRPQEAYLCFMRTNMDYLVMGNFLLDKNDQKPLDKDAGRLKTFGSD